MNQEWRRKNGFLNRTEVALKLGISEMTLYHWVRHGKFPSPIVFSHKHRVWEETDVNDWFEEKLAQRKPRLSSRFTNEELTELDINIASFFDGEPR